MAIYTFDKIAVNCTQKVKPQESDKEHYIGLEHIDPECLYITRWGADAAPIGDKLVMKKGDVLFGKRRAYQRKVGIAPFDGIFSAHGLVLRPKEDVICKEFFPFFISSDQFLDRAVQISVGGLSPTVNWGDLARQEFSLPSLEEQKILADKLWAAYRVKESYRQLLATTDDMVKAQFNEMFGSKKENTILGNFVKVRTGKLDSNAADKDGQYPFFTCSSDTLSINTYAFDCEAVLLAGNGEFSVKYYEGKFNAYQRTYVIESIDKTKLCVPFLYAWMTKYASLLKQQAIGGVIKYIKMGNITDAQLYLPSMEEQQTYLKIYHQAEATKASLRQSIDAIDRVIRSLINQ
jgi:type I restriction enzyme S subunit